MWKYAVTPVGVGGCVPAPSAVHLPKTGRGNGAIDPKGADPARPSDCGVRARAASIHSGCGRLPSGCVRESRVTCRHFALAARVALLAKLAAQRHARRA